MVPTSCLWGCVCEFPPQDNGVSQERGDKSPLKNRGVGCVAVFGWRLMKVLKTTGIYYSYGTRLIDKSKYGKKEIMLNSLLTPAF